MYHQAGSIKEGRYKHSPLAELWFKDPVIALWEFDRWKVDNISLNNLPKTDATAHKR